MHIDLQPACRLECAQRIVFMPESETEAETLERLEVALRKIAGAINRPKPGAELDRTALVQSLDTLINRLRSGLELPKPESTE